MKIVAVGDIMPGGILNGRDKPFIAPEVKDLLAEGDIRVGTLETAIGNSPSFYEEKMKRKADVIYAKDDDMKRLVEMNINIVSLANNHFFDLGPEGATHTIELLDRIGIMHCGAGRNLEEASKPAVVIHEGKSYAFLAFCDWREETTGWCLFAQKNQPGVNPMYDEYVVNEIKKYRSLYDYLVIMPHWGTEHTYRVTDKVFLMAQKMVNAGADLIIGSHPHRVQPVVDYKKAIVAYSLGNFFFPDRLITSPRSTYYPESEFDYSEVPKTYEYPYVDRVTYKMWKPLARIGMILQVTIDNTKKSNKYLLVNLDDFNYLSIAAKDKDKSVKKNLLFYHNLLKYTPYKITYFCSRVINSIIYRIKRYVTNNA